MSQESEERDLRHVSDQIEALLGELSSSGAPEISARAHKVVRLVSELYGAGLEQIVAHLHRAGGTGTAILDELARDDLVASLFLVHGLHPRSMAERVEQALEDVRPYLGSHGGDVELIGVDDDGTVRLRLLGSCDGCPSSQVTLKLAVEGAIESAVPEYAGIEVEGAVDQAAAQGVDGLISPDALLSRRPSNPATATSDANAGAPTWAQLPGVDELEAGRTRWVQVNGADLIVCRTDGGVYAYRDTCARCSASMAEGALEGNVLCCTTCGARFDIEQAGRSEEDPSVNLDPLPVLTRDGAHEVALPAGVTG